jgi:hypothetical protein
MKNKSGYNGWTNYETWVVALWIRGDVESYTYWREVNTVENPKTVCISAEELKTSFQENIPEMPGVYRDLLTNTLSEVNWDEIVKTVLGE